MDLEDNRYLFGGIGAVLIALVAGFVLMGGSNPASGGTGTGETLPGQNQNTQPAQQQSQQSSQPAVEVVSGVSADVVISVRGTAFRQKATVAPGQVVKFVNRDPYSHRVTIRAAGIDVPLPAGGSVKIRFNEAGTYTITCSIHPSMETTVTVRQGASASTSST